MRNDCSINFHRSKLSIAKLFSIPYDISLVRDGKRKLKLVTFGSERVKANSQNKTSIGEKQVLQPAINNSTVIRHVRLNLLSRDILIYSFNKITVLFLGHIGMQRKPRDSIKFYKSILQVQCIPSENKALLKSNHPITSVAYPLRH